MIERDLNPTTPYDVIVVGGGVYGLCVALECTARGLRPLLVERSDFGEETTANSLRIVHGGLRYLQHLDVRRFYRSVDQRRWWLRTFPTLIRPLPCLMPLYGSGLHRRPVLRAALSVSDLLSPHRNRGVRHDREIPRGRVLGRNETLGLFPGCRPDRLRGAALWHDAIMESPHRLMIEILHWITAAGGTALNYVSARSLRTENGRVVGILAKDVLTGSEIEFAAPLVVNAAGPWCGTMAAAFDRERRSLFRPSLAFNLLLGRPLPASVAVAVAAPDPGSPTRFLLPSDGITFAGTVHVPGERGTSAGQTDDRAAPSDAEIAGFLDEINRAVPGFGVTAEDVIRAYWGLLPASQDDATAVRRHPILVDHGREGGPRGLFSVSGVKFTTAPAVARMVLEQACPDARPDWVRLATIRPEVRSWPKASAGRAGERDAGGSLERVVTRLKEIVRDEAVLFAEDLVYRRLDWNLTNLDLDEISMEVARILPDLPLRRKSALA